MGVMSEFMVMAASIAGYHAKQASWKEVNEEEKRKIQERKLVEKLLEYKMYVYVS